MRISDWSSDVCSSDLLAAAQRRHDPGDGVAVADDQHRAGGVGAAQAFGDGLGGRLGVIGNDAQVVDGGGGFGGVAGPAEIGGIEIGKASCRGKGVRTWRSRGSASTLKKNQKKNRTKR